MSIAKRILFLGDHQSPLYHWLRENGETVHQYSDKISKNFILDHKIDFLISYGYRHIIKKDVLDLLPSRAINLHISYLPWNRGADPNLWSFIYDTPKGVTIHYIDEGLDTGDIIYQKVVHFDCAEDTLATSYQKLQLAIQQLFFENWTSIKEGRCPRIKQVGVGSTQKSRDKRSVENLLSNGWDTPIGELNKRKNQNS